MKCIHQDETYSQTARDHAQNPRNLGALDDFNGHARITGPCGDTMEFWLAAENGQLKAVAFITDGCGSSLACGSMATCLTEGKTVKEAANINQQDILESLGGFPKESEHCALLAAKTLNAACESYLANQTAKPEQSEIEDNANLQSRLGRIRHKLVVLSGKGGVGKSTVAVNLAAVLALSGKRVGLLDVDIHGPSIPTMLGLEGSTIDECENGLLPVELGGIKIMSLGFLSRNQDDAVIWRGPMKAGVIKQLLRDVCWGDLDYLIIDSPPGTGDEPLSVCQLIAGLEGAIVVTTPQKVAAVDVRKSVTFCRRLNVPVLGIIENMSGFICPKCSELTEIFCSGGGKKISEDMGVPFLGSIPIDPQIVQAGDAGRSYVEQYAVSQNAQKMQEIMRSIIDLPDASAPGVIN